MFPFVSGQYTFLYRPDNTLMSPLSPLGTGNGAYIPSVVTPILWSLADLVLLSKSPQNVPLDAVSVYFLDHKVFHRGEMTLSINDTEVPKYVSDVVGDSASVTAAPSEYFQTVHLWWSILSQGVFHRQVLNPLVPRCEDTALLLLCMKLII